MATRRAMGRVLWNFLGTYTSRYTDRQGYWLFGFLVAELDELRIDLVALPPGSPDSPTGWAIREAVGKFEDQRSKAGVAREHVREAWLTIRKLPGTVPGAVHGHPVSGHDVCFLAQAVMDDGRHWQRERVVFVAPHDARHELRSPRGAGHEVDGIPE